MAVKWEASGDGSLDRLAFMTLPWRIGPERRRGLGFQQHCQQGIQGVHERFRLHVMAQIVNFPAGGVQERRHHPPPETVEIVLDVANDRQALGWR